MFSSMRGCRISGIEALMVQGYSPYAVDIMNMTDGLLTDMAGNAMSTTVVGAFMFAALI